MADEEPTTEQEDTKEDDQLRITVANTYTFVRSREINKTISNFAFDHYVDEAKRRIKEDRILRSASTPNVGARPSQLSALKKLQEDFNKGYTKAKELAEISDKTGEQQERD